MKKCPFCAEEIQDKAVKCRYCNEFLAEVPPPRPKTPWYAKTSVLVLGFLSVGPLVLPLVWFHPRYSRRTKILVTAVVLGITCVLGLIFYRALSSILDYYKEAGIF